MHALLAASASCEVLRMNVDNTPVNTKNAKATAKPVAYLGLDIGSTTTKAVVVDARTRAVLYSTYRRHHAHQAQSLKPILVEIAKKFPNYRFYAALSGSGGKAIADYLGIPYMQEVVANAVAVQGGYPQARCAIELGGQDAKMIFFERDEATGALNVSDMRMNGSCAGGTGAFIDEIASLLQVPVEELNGLAERGETVYSISGRCGVYAKTDIQPLLNQGARKEDIALSAFHAIAKQTLGGLAQGLDINPPVIFEGGPLTFNTRLVGVFAERLDLADDQVIIPENPETIVAQGCAFALNGRLRAERREIDLLELAGQLEGAADALAAQSFSGPLYFESESARRDFEQRHALPLVSHITPQAGETVRAYLGIDSGSTTTKFALINEDEQLIDAFYASNEGEPLDIAVAALVELDDRFKAAGAKLDILGLGTTGYGEALFAKAFHADTHMVETVAHEAAAAKYVPDVSFILDIGGQDMKAIWVDNGVVTDILVNEACSSGCGSFLESFAKSLGVAVTDIAPAAFRSKSPAVLGSRCTVFMNSSVVTEQKNGKTPDDIMAGLCRSIIENVFTKVIRVSNVDKLGDKIVVQGGTFQNDAVLAAFEQYVGKPVVRAPYPGLMGAIGAALLTKRAAEREFAEQTRSDGGKNLKNAERAAAERDPRSESQRQRPTLEGSESQLKSSRFIGFDALRSFSYTQESNATCPFCSNACNRTVVRFADGTTSVTGNRCERGEVVGDIHDASVRQAARDALAKSHRAPNLFDLREKLVFKDYPVEQLLPENDTTIGIPRVLAYWDRAPFWTTFLRALGFSVMLSGKSTRKMFESGLSAVTSDTVCFPAKLVHGHIRDLVARGADRVFMPVVTTVQSENRAKTSESMCAVVKGYSLVIQNSDNPTDRFGVPFDNPLFHWYTAKDRLRQLSDYMQKEFGIAPEVTAKAIDQGQAAMDSFHVELLQAGKQAIDDAQRAGGFAVVLGSRPYHNDPLVNHDVPEMFASQGIAVLPPDAVPGANDVDLSNSRIDIVNNFHARMLGASVLAAQSDCLEFVQLVSFGCGHDAYLSDEIVRMMHEVGGKTPLILKVDESDAAGPLRIRVRSFVETVRERYATGAVHGELHELPDPYPQKFTRADRKRRVVLVPNTSHAFSRMMAAVFARQGLTTVALPIGREEAIRLGKKYVHNDICFPAQMTIGEALAELETGKYDDCEVAVGTGKYVGDCRLTHYAALLRKALDDAGYKDVAIITNDDVDAHDMQPGWKMSIGSAITCALVLPMIDVLEELLRKMRPYELVPGAANAAFEQAMDELIGGIEHAGARGARAGFKRAIDIMRKVEYDRSHPRPTVLIVGEYLLNFHPGANHDIEDYLEKNGFEIIEARMTDVIRKTYFYKDAQVREYNVNFPVSEKAWYRVANSVFDIAHDMTDSIAKAHPLYEPAARMDEIVQASDPIIHHTFDAGEGVLIPAEIIHHAKEGCRAFVILQPFGCLPNHVVGRGISKRLKAMFPEAQILPLDYDPDVSFANVENRLQMLVMAAAAEGASVEAPDSGQGSRTADSGKSSKSAEAVSVETADSGMNPEAKTADARFAANQAGDAEFVAQLAECAASISDIADEMAKMAKLAQRELERDKRPAVRLEWGMTHGAEVADYLIALAKRADDVATRAEELASRARDASQHRGEGLSERAAATAERVRDLAVMARDKMNGFASAVSGRFETATVMAEEENVDAAKAKELVDEASVQVDRMSDDMDALLRQADEIVSRAYEAEKLTSD